MQLHTTFVSTNIVTTIMTIEEIIKSNVALDDAKKVILNVVCNCKFCVFRNVILLLI